MATEAQDGTLSVTDNRTGKTYEVAITDGTVRATELRNIKVSDDDFGLMTYDPAFTNTASTKSEITFIDGDKGILEYSGYPIDELAERISKLPSFPLVNVLVPTHGGVKMVPVRSFHSSPRDHG